MRIGRAAVPPSFTVRLPGDRVIAIEEFGDPKGAPVLYFHGWPACRMEAGLIPNLPVRLLALDRPGYGRSSPQPGRTLLDWTRDVAFVADRLGLPDFHIVGLSGGGPYAAACAWALPERVRSVALVCPVPPAYAVHPRAAGLGHLFRLGRYPRVAHHIFGLARPLLKRRIITPRTVLGRFPAADRSALSPPVMAALARVWREGFGRGIQGALSDAHVYARDWGFPLDGIRVPTSLWHGQEDTLIPASALAPFDAIPGLRRHSVPNEGHFSLALRRAGEILAELTEPQLSSTLSQYR